MAIAPDSPANRNPRKTADARTAALIKRESTRKEHAGCRGISGTWGSWGRGGAGVSGVSGGDGGADGGEVPAPSRSRARRAGTSEAEARLGCWLAAESATRSDDTPWAVELIVYLSVSASSSASDKAMACSVVRCGYR
eukprot:3138736-Pleurochrysis_carterae.AAC.3